MTISRSIGHLSFVVFLSLMIANRSLADSDFRQMASYFGLPLDPVIDYQQQPSLGADYRQYFKTTGDFNYKTANQFGLQNPQKIAPFRKYLQQLVDDGYIEQATALSLLRGAILGAIETFGAQQHTMIQRPAQRNAQDSRELADDLYLNEVQASLEEKIDGLSERVDALARLSNLSEIQQNVRRTETTESMDSIQTELNLKITGLDSRLTNRIERFDQQLGTLSDAQFTAEIESLLQQMNTIRLGASEQSKAIQSKVDNALFEVFARISQAISDSERREQKFIDNELRLFRDTSDLRARVKILEESLTKANNELEEISSQQQPPLNSGSDPEASVAGETASTIASRSQRPETQPESIAETPGLVGAARVISRPTHQSTEGYKLLNADDPQQPTNWASEAPTNRE